MLKAQSLSIRRGRRLVLRGLDFEIGAGGLLLVTGRNGSGKSSLLRALAGLLPLHDGRIFWQSEAVEDFAAHRARRHYLGHLDALKPELTVSETILYWRALRGLPAAGVPQDCGLEELENLPVRHLSAGQKRRLALARLALSDAPLWLLDEPNASLDKKGQDLLRDLLARHRAKGGVAVIAAHDEDFQNAARLDLRDAS